MYYDARISERQEHMNNFTFITFFLFTLPVEMEQTGCSETSAHKIQTQKNHTKNNTTLPLPLPDHPVISRNLRLSFDDVINP